MYSILMLELHFQMEKGSQNITKCKAVDKNHRAGLRNPADGAGRLRLEKIWQQKIYHQKSSMVFIIYLP